MSSWYDRQGKKIDMFSAAALLETDNKTVASTQNDEYWVSTVWLGLDHCFDGGKPLIFETMVFPITDGAISFSDQDCQRYSTEEEAIKGHEEMCRKWLKQTKEDV